MSDSYTNLLYYIVLSPKIVVRSFRLITRCGFMITIGGTIRSLGGTCLELNGTEAHIHLLAKFGQIGHCLTCCAI